MEPTTIDAANDAELREILATLLKPVYPLSEITTTGPFGPTKTYEEVNSGRLKTFIASGRRLALAIDYARWLLLLKREGAAKPNEGPLSEPARDRQRERQRQRQRASAQPAAA